MSKRYPVTLRDLEELLPFWVREPDPTLYEWGTPLFLDFETTGLDKGSALNDKNRLLLACWQLGWDGKLESRWGGEFDQHTLVEDIDKADFIVAHNAKFELQWLARCGVDISKVIVYDTQLAEYVIGGNRWKTEKLSLELCARRHSLGGKVGVVSRMIKAGVPPEDIPREWMERYCLQDVRLLPRLMRSQLDSMSKTRLLPVVYSRCLLTPVLADIERNGMALDAEQIIPLWKEAEARLAALERQVNGMAGELNLNSPKQKATFLYDTLKFPEPTRLVRGKRVPDRTTAGGRRTDADTIAALPATTKEQKEFKALMAEALDVSGQLTKYLRKFKACCEEAGGVLFGAFNQTQTFTHRLSSNGLRYRVQFQNFPRAFKQFFRAKLPGNVIGEVDGAQLEFRAAAHLGRCIKAILDIAAGEDIHSYTASVLTEAGQPTDRQGAKEHTFKPLYGGSSGTDAEKAYYAAFREKYKGIDAAQQGWINTVLLEKKLETEWGLVYYWPDTRMDRSGYIQNTTSICNYPVQAFATAEIIPLALVMMWHALKRLPELHIELVNTVHDSIVAEFAPELSEAFHALSRVCMIDGVYAIVERLYGIRLVAPLGCGVKIGERWGTGKETKYSADESLYRAEAAA